MVSKLNIKKESESTEIEIKPKKRRSKAEKIIEVEEVQIQEKFTAEFTAEIKGIQCEGIMIKFEDRSIYLCQNFIVGGFINKRLRKGYKYSVFVGYGEVDKSIVKNFKITN